MFSRKEERCGSLKHRENQHRPIMLSISFIGNRSLAYSIDQKVRSTVFPAMKEKVFIAFHIGPKQWWIFFLHSRLICASVVALYQEVVVSYVVVVKTKCSYFVLKIDIRIVDYGMLRNRVRYSWRLVVKPTGSEAVAIFRWAVGDDN